MYCSDQLRWIGFFCVCFFCDRLPHLLTFRIEAGGKIQTMDRDKFQAPPQHFMRRPEDVLGPHED